MRQLEGEIKISTYKIGRSWEVIFEDGTIISLEPPDQVYCFQGQEYQYLVKWLEELIEKYNITSQPLEIKEKMNVITCKPYDNIIGV